MDLLTPAWLLLGLLSLPILLMYMLKLRRREVIVPSTLLWQAALRDRQANTPWQRIKRNLLLFLQLLILAGLVLALSRPAIRVRSVATGSLVVILDASASMAATDVNPSRFEAAREAARKLIQELDSQSRMTLILAAKRPIVLASGENDKARLKQALDSAQVTQGAADWKAVLALAAGASSQNPGGQGATTVVISDGGLPGGNLPPLPGEVRYLPIGSSADNLAISALASRDASEGSDLFTRISNFDTQDRLAVLSIYRDGQLLSAQQITIPAQDSAALTFEGLPGGRSIYQAKLSPLEGSDPRLDALALDDSAFTVSQPTKQGRVLVVTKGNFFLEQILAALPTISPYRAVASASSLEEESLFLVPEEPFDLYVLDGILPSSPKTGLPVLPDGNLLLINPPPTVLFAATGVFTDTADMRTSDDPLMQYVDWSDIHIARATYIQLPEWAEILVSAGDRPILFAGETGGRRVAVFAFDLHDSDMPLQVTFPILISNLVNYLSPAQHILGEGNIEPGTPVRILPGTGIQQIAIASPSNQTFSLIPQENELQFNDTAELGVYAVNFLKEDSQEAEFFAVNLFDESESDIRPAASIQIGQKSISAVAEQKLAQRELWPWLAALALVILAIEWWVFHRRSLGNLWRQ